MSAIHEILLERMVPKVASELLPQLQGEFGELVRAYLPQRWWFTTRSGHATFEVDKEGRCRVQEGANGAPDVVVTWTDEALTAALGKDPGQPLPPGTPEMNVLYGTENGRVAFEAVREVLGI